MSEFRLTDPEALAQLDGLTLRARHVVEGALAGLHRSPFRGANVEFAEHREYAPGDDLRRLDWRVFGRTDRYYIKQYEEESHLSCTIVVDASRSMEYASGAMTKYEYAATLAVSVAVVLLRQRDSVGLALCDQMPHSVIQPVATRAQLQQIAKMLEAVRPDKETDLGGAMGQLIQSLRRRGLVVVLSDLFTDEASWLDSLARLRFQGHEAMVFHVLDPDELDLPFRDPVLFHDVEGDDEVLAEPWAFREAYQSELGDFLRRMEDACHRHRVDYIPVRTDQPPATVLRQFLHARGQRGS